MKKKVHKIALRISLYVMTAVFILSVGTIGNLSAWSFIGMAASGIWLGLYAWANGFLYGANAGDGK